MRSLIVKPGDIVVTNFGLYQHWSLVTDQVCSQGLPMLISATKRNGTVREESWHSVTEGKETYVADIKFSTLIYQVLDDARSQIGNWSYSVTERNCEHFIKWATGLEVSSNQVNAGVGGAVVGVALVGIVAKNPNAAKFLGTAFLVAGLAIAAAKVAEAR